MERKLGPRMLEILELLEAPPVLVTIEQASEDTEYTHVRNLVQSGMIYKYYIDKEERARYPHVPATVDILVNLNEVKAWRLGTGRGPIARRTKSA